MSERTPQLSRTRLLSGLLLVGIFLAGGLTGVGLERLRARGPIGHPPGFGQPNPDQLAGLALTPEQERLAHSIGERYRPELEALRREMQPRVLAIHQKMQSALREVLTPNQQAQFDANNSGPPAGPPGSGGLPEVPGSPPPEALTACAAKKSNDPCSIQTPRGEIIGTCRIVPAPDHPLACVPEPGE